MMRRGTVRWAAWLLQCSQPCRMRFDRRDDDAAHDSLPADVRYSALHESMLPQQVAPEFTPFPLPKYDPDLGFGPVRLRNVPDIAQAEQRLASRAAATLYADDVSDAVGESAADDTVAVPRSPSPTVSAAAEDALQGYAVSRDFPYVDRLECHRTPESLLEQFVQRPEREARTATILDLAAILPRCDDAALGRVLYELGAPFTPEGQGLNFLVTTVNKLGRPYAVTSELTKAYVHFVAALGETLVQTQPHRLCTAPALLVRVLHFLALIKVFTPNAWYTIKPNMTSNRADYTHARGVNAHTSHQGVGEELFDHLTRLVTADDAEASVLERCSAEQLVDILAGFAGIAADGVAAGAVTRAVLHVLLRRWRAEGNAVREQAVLERLYLVLRLQDVTHDDVLHALLDDPVAHDTAAATVVAPLHLASASCRGPDFFAAVSRERQASVQARALALLRDSVAAADEPRRQALYESGTELLMTLRDTAAAAQEARALGFDAGVLRGMPGLETVAAHLAHAADDVTAVVHDVQASLYAAARHEPCATPVRTLLPSLADLNGRDAVFLLHSSAVHRSVDRLVSVVRRMACGKEALIVTTQCLRGLTTRAHYAATAPARAVARRALDIVAYELERGRAVLVPVSQELLLHDPGVYCDEDLMLWTLAAYFARELPLVKVFAMISAGSSARYPYHFLKGEHSVLRRSDDVYNKDVPLLRALSGKELRAVTHFAGGLGRVRDAACTLYNVKPNRARLPYRRDKAMFDKYHVTARHLAPGFSQGALASDLRGLGYYTPDHPQVPYTPLQSAPSE